RDAARRCADLNRRARLERRQQPTAWPRRHLRIRCRLGKNDEFRAGTRPKSTTSLRQTVLEPVVRMSDTDAGRGPSMNVVRSSALGLALARARGAGAFVAAVRARAASAAPARAVVRHAAVRTSAADPALAAAQQALITQYCVTCHN